MTVVENKAACQSYFEQFINSGEMAAADAIFVQDVIFHYPLGDLNGTDAVKGYIK